MSNISTVKSALDAEIQHARQGLAFYVARIEALENLIGQLDRLDAGPVVKLRAKGKRAGTRRANGAVKPPQGAKTSGRSAGLPKTGGAFWQSLLSTTPMSNQELLDAAIATLKVHPTPADLKKLKQRLANAVTLMTKDGSMQSDGTGRARRFSKTTA